MITKQIEGLANNIKRDVVLAAANCDHERLGNLLKNLTSMLEPITDNIRELQAHYRNVSERYPEVPEFIARRNRMPLAIYCDKSIVVLGDLNLVDDKKGGHIAEVRMLMNNHVCTIPMPISELLTRFSLPFKLVNIGYDEIDSRSILDTGRGFFTTSEIKSDHVMMIGYKRKRFKLLPTDKRITGLYRVDVDFIKQAFKKERTLSNSYAMSYMMSMMKDNVEMFTTCAGNDVLEIVKKRYGYYSYSLDMAACHYAGNNVDIGFAGDSLYPTIVVDGYCITSNGLVKPEKLVSIRRPTEHETRIYPEVLKDVL